MGGPDHSAVGARAVDDILEHHGVKGMKWGVRKKQRGVTISTAPGKRVKSVGGHGHPVHQDAGVAAALKQKAKKSGMHTLSNHELQQLNTRMNLEQQYSRLSSQNKGKGAKFVTELLANVGKQQVTKIASDALGAQISKALIKKKGG